MFERIIPAITAMYMRMEFGGLVKASRALSFLDIPQVN